MTPKQKPKKEVFIYNKSCQDLLFDVFDDKGKYNCIVIVVKDRTVPDSLVKSGEGSRFDAKPRKTKEIKL